MAKKFIANGWTRVAVMIVAFGGMLYGNMRETNRRLAAIEKSVGDIPGHHARIAVLEASLVVNPHAFNDAVQSLNEAAKALRDRAEKGG